MSTVSMYPAWMITLRTRSMTSRTDGGIVDTGELSVTTVAITMSAGIAWRRRTWDVRAEGTSSDCEAR